LRGVSKDPRLRSWPSFEARRKVGEHLRMTAVCAGAHAVAATAR